MSAMKLIRYRDYSRFAKGKRFTTKVIAEGAESVNVDLSASSSTHKTWDLFNIGLRHHVEGTSATGPCDESFALQVDRQQAERIVKFLREHLDATIPQN
jgi:hypothetical protein